jgi:5-methyltetrahydrofolate--homocysteine methyltransferase
MVDSSKWEVIEAGLKCLQGKGHRELDLAQGRRRQVSPERRTVLKYGAAVVVMAFDEQGQAATYEEKIRICERAYRILVDELGSRRKTSSSIRTSSPSPPAWRSITTTRWTSSTPRAGSRPTCRTPRSAAASRTSRSVSGQQQGSRGDALRVLLSRHRAGMDMGIVNAGMLEVYEEIEPS